MNAYDDTPDLPVAPPNPAVLGWSPALLIDLVLGTTDDNICAAYNLQYHELAALKANPAFVSQLAELTVQMRKDGVTFEMKAKAQADALLDTAWQLIHSPLTPANVKADLIKSTVRWAGHEKKGEDQGNGGRSGFSLNINLGGLNPGANSSVVTIEGIGGE